MYDEISVLVEENISPEARLYLATNKKYRIMYFAGPSCNTVQLVEIYISIVFFHDLSENQLHFLEKWALKIF